MKEIAAGLGQGKHGSSGLGVLPGRMRMWVRWAGRTVRFVLEVGCGREGSRGKILIHSTSFSNKK